MVILKHKNTVKAAACIAGAAFALGCLLALANAGADASSAKAGTVFPKHAPLGRGVGAMPGRVVWVHDTESVEWDGKGYWWTVNHFGEPAILRMVDSGIASLAGKGDARSGWDALFRAHNATRGRNGGYARGQKIAIKCNMNGAGAYGDDPKGETRESYTNPVLLRALLVSLVTKAGVSPRDITVYDAGRVIPDYVMKLCSGGALEGVNFRYRDIAGPNDAKPDTGAPVVWSRKFSGDKNYLPKCVTEAAYLINLANLKGHVYGVTLCAKNHFGSILNSNRMRAPEAAGLHRFVAGSEMKNYAVLADLMANYQLGGKTMLYMLDAIITAPGESMAITGENSRWRQTPFNNDYASSVFFSQDPVAIDSVGTDFLANEPAVVNRNGALRDNSGIENYLHEAALASNPPSGAAYLNGKSEKAGNLGVHEHWNNAQEKKYSRNLGKSEGIELVYIKPQREKR